MGLADHEALAVEAGVHVLAVTVFGVEQHVLVFLDHVDDVQLDAQLLGHPQGVVAFRLRPVLLANGVGVSLHAEAGEEIDPFHVDALFKDHLRGEQGIEPSGYEGDGLALCVHAAGVDGHPAIRVGKGIKIPPLATLKPDRRAGAGRGGFSSPAPALPT